MSKKIQKTTSNAFTIEQAQEAGKVYTEKSNKLEKMEARINEEVNKVKSRYSDEITVIKEELQETKEFLEVYAKEQRNNWGDKKSCELLHARIGFRESNPKVNKQKQFTWDAVLELMKKQKNFRQFIRVKEEINKEAILSLDMSDKKNSSLLKQLNDKCYLFIDNDEKFFVAPKKECLN